MIVSDKGTDIVRVNARKTDAFDIFNCRHYTGPNPYLNTGAFVFDFALTHYRSPLPLAEYVAVIGDRYPQLKTDTYDSYAHLFARTAAEVSKLEMELHLEQWSLQVGGLEQGDREQEDWEKPDWEKPDREEPGAAFRIGIESLHARTSRAIVYCVWDWFEAITQQTPFSLSEQIGTLQDLFRQSVYGGPTVYALLRTARDKGIPTFYLWDEGLMQYGYGKQQVRGIATTFDLDSHLDSDFTTRKDDCKAFLGELGFPVPRGDVVNSLEGALSVARRIGFPVAVKPVDGHKGIGVTADVQDEDELAAAYRRAVRAIPEERSIRIIVETSLSGKDYRLLCVNGRFVAAMERRPAYVVGDGRSTIADLIDRENRSPARSDTPTSPLGKIKIDEAMDRYLEEQHLAMESVLERDRTVYLRKVANLSSGGLSIDATRTVHPDNIILAQDVAQHFRLTCMGIDVMAQDLSQSWKHSPFGIIEINAAPGIYMHLKPASGEPVDVTSRILETFFTSATRARIPILTFNRVSVQELQTLIDHILLQHPDWTIGAVCRDGVFVNRSEKRLNPNYNTNVLNLLRNPRLDLLIAEYRGDVLQRDGMFYYGSNLVVLDNPSATERILARDVFEDSTIVTYQNGTVTIQRQGLMEQYQLGETESFPRVYLKELGTVLPSP